MTGAEIAWSVAAGIAWAVTIAVAVDLLKGRR